MNTLKSNRRSHKSRLCSSLNKKFIILCDNCLSSHINGIKDKIIKFEDLLEHKPFIYNNP